MVITTDFNNPLNWLLAVMLLVLLGTQCWLLWRNRSLSPRRKGIRLGLNAWLWLLLVAYFLQPQWPRDQPPTHVLLVGAGVPMGVARRVQDSLHIPDRRTTIGKDLVQYDSVTLLGQRFPGQLLPQLSRPALRWLPYDLPDQLSSVGWQGVVRAGENQSVTGWIMSSKNQVLRLTYGQKTLDSLNLTAGNQAFRLQFPAFARGRTQVELRLGSPTKAGMPMDTIHFFCAPVQPLTVQFLMSHPDFEAKNVADWLGKRGHSVQLTTMLSRNIAGSTTINKPTIPTKQLPDLLIVDPANASAAPVRKALAEGRAVLFMGLTDAEADCRAINQATGTRFLPRPLSNQLAVPITAMPTALPYRLADAPAQLPVAGYPVAFQKTVSHGGRADVSASWVGVSLLNETFPLALAGDSLAYAALWTAVLARLYPAQNTGSVAGPLLRHVPVVIDLNSHKSLSANRLYVGSDTVSLTRSVFNGQTAHGWYLPADTGWQTVNDSLAVFVEPASADNPVVANAIMARFMAAHARYRPATVIKNHQTNWQPPGWFWLTVFLLCLTALWIEPKLSR